MEKRLKEFELITGQQALNPRELNSAITFSKLTEQRFFHVVFSSHTALNELFTCERLMTSPSSVRLMATCCWISMGRSLSVRPKSTRYGSE